MNEHEILTELRALMGQEHRLRATHRGRPWNADDLADLHRIEHSIAGLWTDLASSRDPSTAAHVPG